jgi:quercetin dioxygenase-like cupin family protein
MEGRNGLVMERTCDDLDKEIESLLGEGYRLDMIMPADAPQIAVLSNKDQTIRLTTDPRSAIGNPQSKGRAGMEYHDLIPDRLNGRVIASHIRITEGGPVPDYVHYHKLRFQMIYCIAGWVRVVYEDQGEPFVMNAGDCVLQPPGIRHRVLESSAGTDVFELSSPAIHETWVDHDLILPNQGQERVFGEQRFVRHVAADTKWISESTFEYRDTGISSATNGMADVRVVRSRDRTPIKFANTTIIFPLKEKSELLVFKNENGAGAQFIPAPGAEFLQITLSTDLV